MPPHASSPSGPTLSPRARGERTRAWRRGCPPRGAGVGGVRRAAAAVSRRAQIAMDAGEVAAFLAQERTVICVTIGPRGWPHPMPLWYVLRSAEDGLPQVWAWTYAASQKVRNIERDPRASLLIEAGETYERLRGVMLECEAIVHRDLPTVSALGAEILARHAPDGEGRPAVQLDPQATAVIEAQARKRVALQFVERRRASFDHRKLAGVY